MPPSKTNSSSPVRVGKTALYERAGRNSIYGGGGESQ